MSTMIERLTEASQWKDGRGEPLESVFVTAADLREAVRLLSLLADARKGLLTVRNAAVVVSSHNPPMLTDFGDPVNGPTYVIYGIVMNKVTALLARLEGK